MYLCERYYVILLCSIKKVIYDPGIINFAKKTSYSYYYDCYCYCRICLLSGNSVCSGL